MRRLKAMVVSMCCVDRGKQVSIEKSGLSVAELRTSYGPILQGLVEEIFSSDSRHQIFQVTGLQDGELKRFAGSDDVFELLLEFVANLRQLIKMSYPDAVTARPQNVRVVSQQKLALPEQTLASLAPSPMDLALMQSTPSKPALPASDPNDVVRVGPLPSIPAELPQTQSQAQTEQTAKATTASPLSEPRAVESPVAQADDSAASDASFATNTPVPPVPSPASTPAFSVPAPVPSVSRAAPTAVPASQPTFVLPNCKVGTEYAARIEGRDASGRELEIVDLSFPDNFGLHFDRATQMVRGVPTLSGEHMLNLQWRFPGFPSERSGECRLTSNPDPRSLWRVVEPDGSLPYQKKHLDHELIRAGSFDIAAASRRGRSHEHGGTFRDDDFFVAATRDNGWAVLIVADGAGSAEFSREGSRIAVETAGRYLVDGLDGEFGTKLSTLLHGWDVDPTNANTIGQEFHYSFHRMAMLAVQAIENEAGARGAPVRSFATTLLAAAVRRDGDNTFLATFWMGDGAIVSYAPPGIVKLMGTPDGGEFAGQTRFLERATLADGFAKRVRIGRYRDMSSVILLTDGVSDPYFETDNGLVDPSKWDALWSEVSPLLSGEDPSMALVEWLHFFKQGHHDDRTIAMLW
ncbi:protein phosphatase 2C domain-containing protein [Paraburkholderia terrae]